MSQQQMVVKAATEFDEIVDAYGMILSTFPVTQVLDSSWFLERWKAGALRTWIARDTAGDTVATISLYRWRLPHGKVVHQICYQAVDRDLRGAGLGQQMLSDVLTLLQEEDPAAPVVAFMTHPEHVYNDTSLIGELYGESEARFRFYMAQENAQQILRDGITLSLPELGPGRGRACGQVAVSLAPAPLRITGEVSLQSLMEVAFRQLEHIDGVPVDAVQG